MTTELNGSFVLSSGAGPGSSSIAAAMKSTLREKHNTYIHLAYLRKDYNDCLRLIEEQLRACNGQSEYPLYVKALILRKQGRIEESLTTFQAALCLNPMNVTILKQVGRSLYLLGKHKTAIDVFDEAEQISSDDREIQHYKGMCFMLYQKQYDKAIDCFESANSIQRHESSFIQLGRIYRILGREEEALQVYLEALETSPENPEILTTIGLLYLKLGNNTKAFEYLGNALTFDPKNAKAILAAGSIIQDNQDMDVALVKYRVAAVQTPNSAQLWNNVGMCFFGKGKYVAAVACLKRGAYLAPFEWIISYNLGVVHLTVGQYASAFQYFSTAINLQPTYAKAYMYLAIALARLDDFENSCAAYEKAIELNSEDYLPYLNYAITLFLNDEVERAREHLKRVMVLIGLAAESEQIDPEAQKQIDLLQLHLPK